jgi:polyprenyl P-hydroxybenzoate/phenylacrylic acid decarboxylase-like protein
VISAAGRRTLLHETDHTVAQVEALADVVYGHRDIGAPIASGSFVTAGMVVCPCSVRTLSALALSAADNLITRAGDVMLKEGRPLVAVLRETPLHLGHLRLAAQLTEIGGIVMPPVPAFYARPETVADIVDHTVGRVLAWVGLLIDGLVGSGRATSFATRSAQSGGCCAGPNRLARCRAVSMDCRVVGVVVVATIVAWYRSLESALHSKLLQPGRGVAATPIVKIAQPAVTPGGRGARPSCAPAPRASRLIARRGGSWLQVRSGSHTGPLLYDGTISTGAKIRFRSPRLWVRLGSGSNLDLWVNSRPVTLPLFGTYDAFVTPRGVRPDPTFHPDPVQATAAQSP